MIPSVAALIPFAIGVTPWVVTSALAVAALIISLWLLRERRATTRRLRALLQRADCMLWEAEVRGTPAGLTWQFSAQPSGLYDRLFADLTAPTPGDLWPRLERPDRARMDATSQEAITTGAPGYQQEFRVRKGDTVFWLQEMVTITREGPERWHLVGVVTDVTPWRSAVQSMQAKEEQVHQMLARADCLLWRATVTRDGELLRWGGFQMPTSGLYPRLFGDRDPAVGSKLWSFIKVPDLAAMNARSRAAILSHQPGYEQQFCAITETETIWLREKVSIQPGGPDSWNLVGVLMDVTAQHQAESALAQEKERLAVTFRAMADGIITTDRVGTVLFLNHAAALLIGHDSSMAMGRPVADLLSLRDSGTDQPQPVPVARVVAEDAVVDLPPHTVLVDHRGRNRLVEGRGAPIHAPDSRVIGTVLVLRDVTERVRLEQQAARASKLESVGVLAGGIAHDFNNILTVVLGNLNLLRLPDLEAKAADLALQEAEAGALRARDLTQQLLTFAKGGEPVRAAVHLPEVLRQTAEFTVRGSRAKCEFDLAENLWAVNADRGQLAQVLQNLVLNAAQAMPSGGVISIRARNIPDGDSALPGAAQPGDYVQLSVTDTGAGIPPEHLPQVFDPYFTTRHEGHGLGLATMYSIVKRHQGHIDVQSESGRGTTFLVWFPALRGTPPEPVRPAEPAGAGLRGRILLMDDEDAILRMTAMLLTRAGAEVTTAVDGAKAVEAYRTARATGTPFDLVIMDLTVPAGMSGLEALNQIRAIDPEVKAIVSSGYASDPVRPDFRRYGFRGRIAKPYEVAEFLRVVRSVLAEG